MKTNLPLFKELADLREQICKDLQLPASDRIIQVFLFEDQEHYERFMHGRHPELPVRRAFFIKQQRTAGGPDDLFVYTYWGEHEIYLFRQAAGLASANTQGLLSYPSRSPRKELDFILHSEQIQVNRFEVPDVQFSDHLPLVCDFTILKSAQRAA